MYAEAQEGAAEGAEQGSDAGPAESGGDPDAVDAEFEEVKDEK